MFIILEGHKYIITITDRNVFDNNSYNAVPYNLQDVPLRRRRRVPGVFALSRQSGAGRKPTQWEPKFQRFY